MFKSVDLSTELTVQCPNAAGGPGRECVFFTGKILPGNLKTTIYPSSPCYHPINTVARTWGLEVQGSGMGSCPVKLQEQSKLKKLRNASVS